MNKILFFISCFFVFFIACNKEQPASKISLITSSLWYYDSEIIDIGNDGEYDYYLSDYWDECVVKSNIRFSTDSSCIKYDACFDTSMTKIWYFEENEKQIYLFSQFYDIEIISENQLKISTVCNHIEDYDYKSTLVFISE